MFESKLFDVLSNESKTGQTNESKTSQCYVVQS